MLSRALWVATGALLALLVLEGVLRLLPVSTGLPRTGQFARWPLQNTDPGQRYAYSIGWSMRNAHRGVTNNYGHVAPFDYRPGSHPVIVVGDSYVESLMNDYADTLQGQLARKLGAPESVYGLGVSGLSASDYVALSRQAKGEFAPAAAVYLITDGDFAESLVPQLGSYFLTRSGDGLGLHYEPMRAESVGTRIRKAIGDISLHRYFQVNLHFSTDPLVRLFDAAPQAKAAPAPWNDKGEQEKVADWLLAELPSSLDLPPQCIVFLMDSDRYAIYKPELASKRKEAAGVRQYFIDRAQALGFRVSDLDTVFRREYAQHHDKFDHWPIDRHWNRLGHGIGAQEAYRLLFQSGPTGQAACMVGKRAWN